MIDYLNPSRISANPPTCTTNCTKTAPQRENAESAEIIRDYFSSIRHRRELRVWLTEQIAKETDGERLETLKKMKAKYE